MQLSRLVTVSASAIVLPACLLPLHTTITPTTRRLQTLEQPRIHERNTSWLRFAESSLLLAMVPAVKPVFLCKSRRRFSFADGF
jgi:hypothetical protein